MGRWLAVGSGFLLSAGLACEAVPALTFVDVDATVTSDATDDALGDSAATTDADIDGDASGDDGGDAASSGCPDAAPPGFVCCPVTNIPCNGTCDTATCNRCLSCGAGQVCCGQDPSPSQVRCKAAGSNCP
jgi:hypothetical protein